MKPLFNKIIACTFILFNIWSTKASNFVYPVSGLLSDSISDIVFKENKGQICDQNGNSRPDILYYGASNNLSFHLRRNGISYQINQAEAWEYRNDGRTNELQKEVTQTTIYRLDLNWLNTNKNVQIRKGKLLEGFDNYYKENCPNGVLGVQRFESVYYQNLYNGIDVKWYQQNGSLKYDYLVSTGADYNQIQFQISGADRIYVNSEGTLIVKTPLGDITEEAPLVIQEGIELHSQWVVTGNIVTVDIENIDPSKSFIIDPLVRVWATYYGQTDGKEDCTVDACGNVYLSGGTSGFMSGIATIGAHQETVGGNRDAFVVKFDSSGTRLWGTYYGGYGYERANDCAIDESGNVFMAGRTSTGGASPVIATPGSHQPSFGQGTDGFLVKFDSLGVRLWGTYYGGSSIDHINGCKLDAQNNVYVTGYSASNVGIATPGTHQPTKSGAEDGFLVKFDNNGVRQWGTYYGGTSLDMIHQCAIDTNSDYINVCGLTYSTDIAVTAGVSQQVFGGASDGFLAQFNNNGTLRWGTYCGGTNNESGICTAVDTVGNVYIAGTTDSDMNIATLGSHLPTLAGSTDAFLVKYDSSGVRLWGTYYGNGSVNSGHFCTTDDQNNVYLSGSSRFDNATAISTTGSYQSSFGGGTDDAFLVKFSPTGIRDWGTFYGGSSTDTGAGIFVSDSGTVYFAGSTYSTNAIASPGSHEPTYVFGGVVVSFLVKFYDCTPPTPTDISPVGNLAVCSGESSVLSASGLGIIGWYDAPTDGNLLDTGTVFVTPNLFSSTTFYVQDSTCAESVSRLEITVTVLQPSASTDVQIICDSLAWIDGNTYTSSNNSATYTLVNSVGCDSIVSLDLTITNSNTGADVISACDVYTWMDGNTYTASNNSATYTLVNAAGCDSVVTLDLIITNSNTGVDIISACDAYTWMDGNTYTSSNNSATDTLVNAAGCDSIVTLDLTITNSNTGVDVISACDAYTWMDGNTYTSSNNSATYTLVNSAGCDSVVTLNLTINTVDVSTVTNEVTITSNALGSYQWIDCDQGIPIPGETGQSFIATSNGNYAVIVTENNCSDTSDCIQIATIGLDESFKHDLSIFPNPSKDGFFKILYSGELQEIEVTNVTGQVMVVNFDKQISTLDASKLSSGKYFVHLVINGATFTKEVVVVN